MNEHSSRSHCVFLINVKQENQETNKKLSGKLYLVDLAGSEKVSKTGAEGAVLEEAKNINKSLSALANVISALADAKPYIPYRDSKLTRILQESLGGNAKCTIIICCSPASFNESETRSTLMFGQRAKTVKNVVMVNEELTADEWKRRYEKERDKCARLKGILTRAETELEKWRRGEQVGAEDQVKLMNFAEQIDFIGDNNKLSSSSTSNIDVNTALVPVLNMTTGALMGEGHSILTTNTTTSSRISTSIKDDWEREKTILYTQLDEKDDEINSQLETIEKLNLQLNEQEEAIAQLKKENDEFQTRIGSLESDSESQKDEIKEVLKALEELAVNFDQKQQEAETKTKENDSLTLELDKKLATLNEIKDELDNLREGSQSQRKRILDMMITLLKDLNEIGSLVNGNGSMQNNEFKKTSLMENLDNAEEDFTMARLYVSKLKGEIKLLVQKCSVLDEQKVDQEKSYETKANELEECRLNLIQSEARLKSQQAYTKELEGKKRKLEEVLDTMRDELATVKTQETVSKQTGESEDVVQKALKEQLESHVEQLRKQVKDLRDENDANQTICHDLEDQNQNLKLAYDKLHSDFEKLRKEESERSQKFQEFQAQQEMREQTKQDLKGLEETVAKELQTLHNLRKLFVDDLQLRLKKAHKQNDASGNGVSGTIGNGDDEDISNGNIAQKQKIAFLENNLEQLTKVHKQLVRDNADLRCELPKLEKRLKATMERVKSLETALKEAKEGAQKDRKRYQTEVERIKEAVRQRNLVKKGNVPNISKKKFIECLCTKMNYFLSL
jgi:kinesin family member 5